MCGAWPKRQTPYSTSTISLRKSANFYVTPIIASFLVRQPSGQSIPTHRITQVAQASRPARRPTLKATANYLPDAQMALTVLPCLVGDRIAYAAWITPLHEGGDPSRLPLPAGATLPGQPLTPLHAVIQLSAAQSKDAAGNLQVSMWASFRQSSNTVAPAPPEAAGNPDASPFASPLDSPEVQAAAAAVHAAAPEDRYEKLVALTHTLHRGDVR